ncbi:MAG TPA: GyrI-like domain-containing protein [Cellvibrionaceae bacterium]
MTDTAMRWSRLLNYIDNHLAETLSIQQLCPIANFSPFHFHRQFNAYFGINLAGYIKIVRFKHAAYLLAFRKNISITEIGLAIGFSHAEVFSRAFKIWSGLSPSLFRKQPPWEFIHTINTQLSAIKGTVMKKNTLHYPVDLVNVPYIPLAVLPHRGAPEQMGNSLSAFIDWRKRRGLPPHKARTFNIVYTPIDIEPKDDFRLDLAVELQHSVALEYDQMQRGEILAGLCARIIYQGDDEGLDLAVDYFYCDWLVANPYELRDAPLFFERITFFPAVAMHERETHIYLPVQEK